MVDLQEEKVKSTLKSQIIKEGRKKNKCHRTIRYNRTTGQLEMEYFGGWTK